MAARRRLAQMQAERARGYRARGMTMTRMSSGASHASMTLCKLPWASPILSRTLIESASLASSASSSAADETSTPRNWLAPAVAHPAEPYCSGSAIGIADTADVLNKAAGPLGNYNTSWVPSRTSRLTFEELTMSACSASQDVDRLPGPQPASTVLLKKASISSGRSRRMQQSQETFPRCTS